MTHYLKDMARGETKIKIPLNPPFKKGDDSRNTNLGSSVPLEKAGQNSSPLEKGGNGHSPSNLSSSPLAKGSHIGIDEAHNPSSSSLEKPTCPVSKGDDYSGMASSPLVKGEPGGLKN